LLPSGCPAPLFAIEAGPEIPTVVKDLSRKPGSPAPKHLIFEATGTYDPEHRDFLRNWIPDRRFAASGMTVVK
jgi:hypothetical protein